MGKVCEKYIKSMLKQNKERKPVQSKTSPDGSLRNKKLPQTGMILPEGVFQSESQFLHDSFLSLRVCDHAESSNGQNAHEDPEIKESPVAGFRNLLYVCC